MPVADVTVAEAEDFLYWLRTEYTPRRLSGKQKPLSNKTIYNIWVTLKSFFSWAQGRRFITIDPMARVPRPRFSVKPIDPFTREEIEKLLQACKYSRVVSTSNRRPFKMLRRTYRRDKALILFLVDSGLRASELCALQTGDIDMKTGEVTIKHGVAGGAKGAKGRSGYIGRSVRRSLWRYLVEREDGDDSTSRLFVFVENLPLNKDSLRLLMNRLGKTAGIRKCNPHRFRHTFAINYLRSHGDVLTLQALLGHSSLEMVKRYARIAKIDLQRSHGKSSPVDNWAL